MKTLPNIIQMNQTQPPLFILWLAISLQLQQVQPCSLLLTKTNGWIIGLPELPEKYKKYVQDCSTCKLTSIAMKPHGREKEITRATALLQILYIYFYTCPVDLTGTKRQDDRSLARIVTEKVWSWAEPFPIKDPKYVLVITDDYTRYTWCLFSESRTTKDIRRTLDAFFKKILVQVRTVRNDNTRRRDARSPISNRRNYNQLGIGMFDTVVSPPLVSSRPRERVQSASRCVDNWF